MPARSRPAALGIALIALLLLGAKPNVVLITADTLRADHLGCYGYFRDTSPAIDGLATDGLLFENASATMATTLPSHASIMTSTYPARHGVLSNLRFFKQPVVTSDSMQTAAQLFKAAGYTTAAFTSASPLSEASGIAAGFDTFVGPPHFDDRAIQFRAAKTTRSVLEWLAQAQPPFFLWIHYFDPHDPYDPPPPFDRRFTAQPELSERLARLSFPEEVRSKAERISNRYDGEILYMDGEIGSVLRSLKRRGLYDGALIVFTGDHGEGLWQHGVPDHGVLWQEQIRAPLIVKLPRGPNAPTGRRHEVASLIDILPTAVASLQLPIPTDQLDGIDLLAQTRSYALAQRTRREKFDGDQFTLTGPEWKYHHHTRAPDELYRLVDDPHETRNVIAQNPELAERMRGEIVRLVAESEARSPLQVKSSLPDVIREQLRKLGYGD